MQQGLSPNWDLHRNHIFETSEFGPLAIALQDSQALLVPCVCTRAYVCVCACVRVLCVYACVRVCVRACLRACVCSVRARACVHAFAGLCVPVRVCVCL